MRCRRELTDTNNSRCCDWIISSMWCAYSPNKGSLNVTTGNDMRLHAEMLRELRKFGF